MRALSLLVFSIVSLVFRPFIGVALAKSKPLALENHDQATLSVEGSLKSKGFCYQIFAGKKPIGYIFETQSIENTGSQISKKTYTFIDSQTNKLIETLSSSSDLYLKPQNFSYSLIKNGKTKQHLSGQFKKYPKKYLAEYKIRKGTEKTKYKKISIPEGTVLKSQFLDLIFSKKNMEQLKPHKAWVTEVFNESSGEILKTHSHLDTHSDHLKLIHKINDEAFYTEHTLNGELLSTRNEEQNLSVLKCKDSSSLLLQAEKQKSFQSLFAKKERNLLKQCCQL